MMINERIGLREDYANLQITIRAVRGARERGKGKLYEASLQVMNWRYFEPVRFRLSLNDLLQLQYDPGEYGKALGQRLFHADALGRAYGETLAAAQGQGDGVRLRLVVEPRELQALHWERIFHPVDSNWLPLGSTALTPFSRYVLPRGWDRPLPVTTRPLRLLAVIASPCDLATGYGLDPIAAEEITRLRSVLDAIPELAVTYLQSGTAQPPSLNQIRARLAEGYSFVHFLCHGVTNEQGTALFLEDDQGLTDPVEPSRLTQAFRVLKDRPVFAFLAACESALHDLHSAHLPLAPALVEEGGLQAALGMTDQVGLRLAQTFAGQFYVRLLTHGVVDLAVNEARALVQDDWDWGVPVLYSLLEDNQLIDFPIAAVATRMTHATASAFTAVDEILSARLESHGQALIADLRELVDELGKSNTILVRWSTDFRRTGRDPVTFPQAFESYYYNFKDYYDGQTWVNEKSSCSRIEEVSARVLPRLAPILSPQDFERLRGYLGEMSNADDDLLLGFREYLEFLNGYAERIWDLLNAGETEQALELKREAEAQISPSFQRSKALFERMSHGIEGARAA